VSSLCVTPKTEEGLAEAWRHRGEEDLGRVGERGKGGNSLEFGAKPEVRGDLDGSTIEVVKRDLKRSCGPRNPTY